MLSLLFILCFPLKQEAEKSNLPEKYEKWIKEEVVYIITPREKEAFYKLETNREREMFIEEFWRQRDHIPGTPRNEFKEEHYRRIEYANKTFVRNSSIPGWKTDRGKIYIILGKPQQVMKFIAAEIYPIELWYYMGDPKFGQPPFFRLIFFQRFGVGEYQLYSPISDGPRSLTPLAAGGGAEEEDDAAYKLIKERVSLELAQAAWSSFPGSSINSKRERIPSAILVGQVPTFSHKRVRDEYVISFLEHKPVVEVSHSVNYISSISEVSILQDESGIFFVNYYLEPVKLSVDFYLDRYHTNLKTSIRITDSEGKTIFQDEKNLPIELKKKELKKIKERPFLLYDSFPLIPGNYKFNLLLENTVSMEFTSFEKEISIPEPNSLAMSPIMLANKVDKFSPYRELNKAFRVGSIQIYPSPRKNFFSGDKLYLAFQIFGLTKELEEKGVLEFAFYREKEKVLTLKKEVREYQEQRYFLEEFLLKRFLPGKYTLQVSILDNDGKEILSENTKLSILTKRLPEPWLMTPLGGPSNVAHYAYILGEQYLNKGEVPKARQKFEEAYLKSPETLDFALGYARVLLLSNEYKKVQEVLLAFTESEREVFTLNYFLGKAFQEEGSFEEAISYYQKALSHKGNVVEILNAIGECYYMLGENKEAIKIWQKSLEINPHQEDIKKVIEILKEIK